MIAAKTAFMLGHQKLKNCKMLGTRLLTQHNDTDAALVQRYLLNGGQLSVVRQFEECTARLDKQLQDTVTYVFSQVVSPVD